MSTSSLSSIRTDGSAGTCLYRAQLLVEELVRQQVETFFISPGSRSTPLVAAIAANPRATAIVHFDERGGAFATLGFGRATHHPAAWVTTSGSAVANGFPAVVEASLDNVPMILLTADRPPEIKDTGANQTIDQVKIFGNYVRAFHELTADDSPPAAMTPVRLASQAVDEALRLQGPVHVNCHFREPLVPDAEQVPRLDADRESSREVAAWLRAEKPLARRSRSLTVPDDAAVDSLLSIIQRSSRPLLVVGSLSRQQDVVCMRKFAGESVCPILLDPLSQLRSSETSGQTCIDTYDQLLEIASFVDRMEPDLIVHIGGRIVSKSLLGYIDRYRTAEYVQLGSPSGYYPGERPVTRFDGDLYRLIPMINSGFTSNAAWLDSWKQANAIAEGIFADPSLMRGEPAIAREVAAAVPEGWTLFVGNSMPIRDIDRFARPSAGARVFANRGASGIDGNVATACGIALGTKSAAITLIGDLALLHDLNSLALVGSLSSPMIVVVVNNDGGGIFSFLPIAEHDAIFERYFGTPHGISFESAASLFGLAYRRVADAAQLGAAIESVSVSGESVVIELQTDRADNFRLHREITARVEQELSRMQ